LNAPVVTAPFLAAALMLGLAGLAKLIRPNDTAKALQAAGITLGRSAVRAGSAAEVLVCVLALVVPGAFSGALVALSYAAFTTFVVMARLKGWPLSSCGCFGRPDTKPTYAHAALDTGALAVAAWWAVVARGHLGRLFFHEPWHGAPLGLLVAVIGGLAYLVWTKPGARAAA
jgi:hypothetical protein